MKTIAKNRATRIRSEIVLAVPLILAMTQAEAGQQSLPAKRVAQGGSRVAGKKATAVAAPFRAGEKLEYVVSWGASRTATGAPAATAELEIAGRQAFYGRDAWHFKAVAHTVDLARFLYPLDDQFDSYSDGSTLAGMRFESYIREKNKKQDVVIRMGSENDPVQGDGPMVRVLPGTRDPLGMIYYLRKVDWEHVKQNNTAVYDGKKLYELRAKAVSDREDVKVPAGSYAATKIELRTYEKEREVINARFWIWLAHDAERTPVLMEADLPFGSLRVELKRKN